MSGCVGLSAARLRHSLVLSLECTQASAHDSLRMNSDPDDWNQAQLRPLSRELACVTGVEIEELDDL